MQRQRDVCVCVCVCVDGGGVGADIIYSEADEKTKRDWQTETDIYTEI